MRTFGLLFTVFLFSMLGTPAFSQWEQVGWPGGEIYVEAQLGNTLYGSSGASYYQSTDWGKHWTSFNDGLPVSSYIYSMGGLFVENNKVFITLQRADSGYNFPEFLQGIIYYCTEGDTRWSSIRIAPIHGAYPKTTQIYLLSPDTLFACLPNHEGDLDSTHGGFLSVDAGKSWKRQMAGIPENPKSIFTFHLGHRLFFSWRNAKQPIFYSDNAGLTWTEMSTPVSDSPYWNFWLLNDSTIIIGMGGDHSMYSCSSDYGSTWHDMRFPGSSFIDVEWCHQIDNRIFAGIHTTNDSGHSVYRRAVSTDFGNHWSVFTLADSARLVFRVYGKDNYYFTFVQYPSLWTFLSTDSSFLTFNQVIFYGGFYNYGHLLYNSERQLFASSIPSNTTYYRDSLMDSIWVSSDHGSSWQTKQFSPTFTFRANEPWFFSNNNIYTSGVEKVTSKPSLLVSTDGGNTWNLEVYLPTSTMVKPVVVIGDTLIVAEDFSAFHRTLFLSFRHGLTWDTLRNPLFENLSDAFYSDSILHVVLLSSPQSFSAPMIFVSSDMGYAWDSVVIFSPSKARDFLERFKYGNRWFISSDAKNGKREGPNLLFLTTDNGKHWIEPSGLSSKLEIIPSFSENGKLYALGHSPSYRDDYLLGDEGRNAVYFSDDSGTSWRKMPGYFTEATTLFSDSDYFYAAGQFSLWRIPKDVADVRNTASARHTFTGITNCYPNPATTEMTIGYSIPDRTSVILKAYDITGRERGVLLNQTLDAGLHELNWDTRALPNGTYILRLTAGAESVSKVVQIIK